MRWISLDKLRLPQSYRALARDCYDNCLAYLDEQLGELFDELQRRGVLDRTLVIVTSDHGEGLGEHGLFDHGESLYRTEVRVPLLIVLPSRSQSPGGRYRNGQPPRFASDHCRFGRPGDRFAVSRPVAGRAVAGFRAGSRFQND